ncbi:hypothetical protein [Streptomyces pilosus]|uniref:hypothetical protein n=1 Tax=Streptomyces pilosus TaxID=28893 RepID=UPI0036429C03
MTTPADAEHEARTARLLAITPDEIVRYSVETILDWLNARREWRSARLRQACGALREQLQQQERANARIAAAVRLATGREDVR